MTFDEAAPIPKPGIPSWAEPISRGVAQDLWRAKFGNEWTTITEADQVREDPLWRRILFKLSTLHKDVESTYVHRGRSDPGESGFLAIVYRLKGERDGNG